MASLDATALTPQNVSDTLGVLLKYQDDIELVQGDRLERVLAESAAGT